VTSIRALTVAGEKAVDQAIETAQAEMADMPAIVKIYYASGLLQVALATLTDDVDQDARDAIIRDILSNLKVPPMN
jgi:hypothetical protein